MHWSLYCLIAISLFGGSSVIEKISLSKWDIPVISYLYLITITAFLSCGVIFMVGIETVPMKFILLALFGGTIFYPMAFGFFYNMAIVDAPVMGGLFFIRLIFIGIWGYTFFGEVFLPARYLGIALIIGAAVSLTLAGRKPGKFEGLPTKAVLILLMTCLISSVINALQKYGVSHIDANTWFFYERLGSVPALIFMTAIPSIRKQTFGAIRLLKSRVWIVQLSEFLALAAIYCAVQAYTTGPLTLVAVFVSAMPIMTTLYVLILNGFLPGFVPDVSTRSHWHVRLLLILIGLAGVYLMVKGR